MKTCLTVISLVGLLTLVEVASCGEQRGSRKVKGGPEWKTKVVVGAECKPAEESMDLPTGGKVHATYHFNRNALSATCITGEGILAVTDSGNLLRFDPNDMRVHQEVEPDVAITLLTKAEGVGVLAACADGRVFRIDPKTLRQTEFAKLRVAPQWMTGFRDARKQTNGVVAAAVVRPVNHGAEEIELYRLGFDQPSSETHKLPQSAVGNCAVSAFFLDRQCRLWLGKDMGEWGGWCASLDLNAGKAGQVETLKGDRPQGVYGFMELPDGQVWAYGGMMHFLSSGFIARVDRGKLEVLGRYGGEKEAGRDSLPKRPRNPITHIIPDPKGDGLLVFAYRDLFRVDAKLQNWRHLGNIELRYRWGRPDAIGAYPALRAVHAVEGKSGDLIGTSARDGLLHIQGGRVTKHLVPGQIGDDRIGTILPASGANVLGGEGLWRYARGNWQGISMFPPLPPSQYESWYEYGLMLDPDRLPVALCRSNSSPGAAALTRWKDAKVETLASENGVSFAAKGAFATPDGTYWCAEPKQLLRLVDGKLRPAGKAPDSFLWGLRVVGQGKPPWILYCDKRLYRLAPGTGAQDAALTPVSLPAELGDVHDALARESGQVLLACAAGLRLLNEKSGKVSRCPFAPPKGDVRALCYDGRGRTWLAGSSVWMVDAEGKVHDLGKLARYGVVAHAIGADSTDATGMVVALGTRGVLFVRADGTGR